MNVKIRINPSPRRTGKPSGTLYLIIKWILAVHLAYILIIAVFALDLRFSNPDIFALKVYRIVFDGIIPKKQIYVSSKSIRKRYLNMIIGMEDPSFYSHNGIDIQAIQMAAKFNSRYGGKYLGASTITQQLTRTLVLFPDKLYIRKYLEIIASITIDAIVPKDRILELYVNYAEWGRGIYGINSASWYYYGKPVTRCNDDEIIRLITILPSPVRYTPFTFDKRERLRIRYSKLYDIVSEYY